MDEGDPQEIPLSNLLFLNPYDSASSREIRTDPRQCNLKMDIGSEVKCLRGLHQDPFGGEIDRPGMNKGPCLFIILYELINHWTEKASPISCSPLRPILDTVWLDLLWVWHWC